MAAALTTTNRLLTAEDLARMFPAGTAEVEAGSETEMRFAAGALKALHPLVKTAKLISLSFPWGSSPTKELDELEAVMRTNYSSRNFLHFKVTYGNVIPGTPAEASPVNRSANASPNSSLGASSSSDNSPAASPKSKSDLV